MTRNIIKFVMLIMLVGIISTEVKAQSPEEIMAKANDLYNESAYDSAVVMYKSIINDGYSSAALYYNIGNAYYKLRNYPLAIFYYEKSLKLDPKNEDTKHNIEIANSFVSDKIETVPELFLKTWWNNLSNIMSINAWAVVSIIVFAILLICLFLYFTAVTRVMKKSMFFCSIIMIIIMICTISICGSRYKYLKSNNEGIIIASTITIKSSPSSSSVDLFVLHEGSKVKVIDSTDGWDKIKIANGSIGWLPSSTIIRY